MKLSEILRDKSTVAIATVDSEGMPHSRAFEHQFIIDGKICFSTSNTNNTYKDLMGNPNAEISQFEQAMYTRISGKIKFVTGEEREALKKLLAEKNPKIPAMFAPEYDEKVEIGYFVEPQIKILDFKTRLEVEVEVK